MNQEISEIRELVTLTLDKLENLESKLEQQEEDIKEYIKQSSASSDSNELSIVRAESIRASLVVLREQIDEFAPNHCSSYLRRKDNVGENLVIFCYFIIIFINIF